MGRKRNDKHEMVMRWTWLATTACCTTLHDAGWSPEDIADAMPDAQKRLANLIIHTCYPEVGLRMTTLHDGDAIRMGQRYAENVTAIRAGVTA